MTEHPEGISKRYDIAKDVVKKHTYHLSGGPAVLDLETEGEEIRHTSPSDSKDPFGGALLDVTTASVIVMVCECLRPETLAKVDDVELDRFIRFVWSRVVSA